MGILDHIFKRSGVARPIAEATISIPPLGEPVITWHPDTLDTENLALLALAYGTKVSWLMQTETSVAELFQVLAAELSSLPAGALTSDDVIGQLPTGRVLRLESRPPNGATNSPEIFKLRFFRRMTNSTSANSPMAWVSNDLPTLGLAANIPWSAFLLVAAIWPKLANAQRARFVHAWQALYQLSAHDESIKAGDAKHLHALFLVVTGSYLADAI